MRKKAGAWISVDIPGGSYVTSDQYATLAERYDKLAAEAEALHEAIETLIPWVATHARGSAQEALSNACDLVGYDPFDWTDHPEVLKQRRKTQ